MWADMENNHFDKSNVVSFQNMIHSYVLKSLSPNQMTPNTDDLRIGRMSIDFSYNIQ